MQHDPHVLLQSDVTTVEMKDKYALVENLLRLIDAEQLRDDSLGSHRLYQKLLHASLAEQLRPYIIDNRRNFLVRRFAIDIAEAFQCSELQNQLELVGQDIDARCVNITAINLGFPGKYSLVFFL